MKKNLPAEQLIPSGVFYGIKSVIGPDCVINKEHFYEEIDYIKRNGFDTSLIKISPRAHVITSEHIEEDKQKYREKAKKNILRWKDKGRERKEDVESEPTSTVWF